MLSGALSSAPLAVVLAQACEKHPERFPRGIPEVKAVSSAVWINPPVTIGAGAQAETTPGQESGGDEVAALRASYEAESKADPPASSILTPGRIERRCCSVNSRIKCLRFVDRLGSLVGLWRFHFMEHDLL